MPQETPKVTIICPDAALAERIEKGVVDQANTEVAATFDRPADEYEAVLYVHLSPLEASDEPSSVNFGFPPGPPCEPIMSHPPLAVLEFERLPHRDAYANRSLYLPDLGAVLRGIRIGRILAVAFAEPISVPGTPSEQEPVRTAECLGGFLLPFVDPCNRPWVGFGFLEPDFPYSKCQAALPAPWVSQLVPHLGPAFHIYIIAYPSKERVQEEIAEAYLEEDLQEWEQYKRRRHDLHRDTLNALRDLVTVPHVATKFAAVSRKGRVDRRALLHKYVPVHIEPLLVPMSGDLSRPLGVAVRIGEGGVLLLPECRDDKAKADLICSLAGLWLRIKKSLQTPPQADDASQEGQTGEDDDPDRAEWTEAEKKVYMLHQEACERGWDPPTFYGIAKKAKGTEDTSLDHAEKVRRVVKSLEERVGGPLPGRQRDKTRKEVSVPSEDLDKRSTDRGLNP